MAIEKSDGTTLITQAELSHRFIAAYGLSGKTVEVDLPTSGQGWLVAGSTDFSPVRRRRSTQAANNSSPAGERIEDLVEGDKIELDGCYEACNRDAG